MKIADDFGLGRSHDAVILQLLESGLIDGTSVMIDGDMSDQALQQLKRLRADGKQVGLHLNLTQPLPNSGFTLPLPRLLKLCLLARISPEVAADLQRQAERFIQLFGSPPDYYDGHQHCHCLPGIAEHVAQLPREESVWARIPAPQTLSGLYQNIRAGGFKVLLIVWFAVRAKRIFTKQRWPLNDDFSGFLDLASPENVTRWLPRLLDSAPPDCLFMLHPGDETDPYQCSGHTPIARRLETEILKSRSILN